LWGAEGSLAESGVEAVMTGMIEQTLGCRAVVDALPSLASQTGAIAFLMGFGGLCVFAQVAGFAAKADLRLVPFLVARLLHGCLAVGLSQLGLRYLPLSVAVLPDSVPLSSYAYMTQFWQVFKWNLLSFGVMTAIILFLIWRRSHRYRMRV